MRTVVPQRAPSVNTEIENTFDSGNIVHHCSRMNTGKTEEIKVRVEPFLKLSFEQIADREHLDLSDIVRRALREWLEKRTPHVAHV